MATWIIGAGGLLGSALTRAVRTKNVALFTAPRLSWARDELEAQLKKAIDDFAAFSAGPWEIHWAAGTGTMSSSADDAAQDTAVVRMFLRLLGDNESLMGRQGVLTFASSAGAVYAGSTDDVITESTAPAPTSPYGREKLVQEEIVRAFAETHAEVQVLIARFSNLYGPDQSALKKQGLLTHIARSVLRRKPVHIYVPFDTIRDYIAADDAAAALLASVHGSQRPRIALQIIASEEPVTIAEIIGIFKRVSRVSPRIVTGRNTLGDSYPHRMRFRSAIRPEGTKKTSLFIGIAGILNAERRKSMSGGAGA